MGISHVDIPTNTNIPIDKMIAPLCATGSANETLAQSRWRMKLRSCATEPVPVPVHTKKHGTEVRSMGMVMGIVIGTHTHKFLENVEGICVDMHT